MLLMKRTCISLFVSGVVGIPTKVFLCLAFDSQPSASLYHHRRRCCHQILLKLLTVHTNTLQNSNKILADDVTSGLQIQNRLFHVSIDTMKYELKRSFGLLNVSTTFQCLMNRSL